MGIVAVLLDKCKKRADLRTDMALGAKFEVTRQVVSQWRSGSAYPDENHIAKIAACAGEVPEEWLIHVRIERASGEARKAWMAAVKKVIRAA